MDIVHLLLPTLEHFRLLGYWIILALALWESTAFVGMAIPGVLLFPTVGFLVAHGYFDPIDAFWFCFLGAMGGYCLSYYLGTAGDRFASRFGRLTSKIDAGKKYLSKYGLWAMIPGRFMAIGSLLPFLAGFARLPFRHFVAYSGIANGIGMVTYLLFGYFARHAWISLGIWSTRLVFFLATTAGLLGIFYLIRTLVVKGAWPLFIVLASIICSAAEGVGRNPLLKTFIDRHPRCASFFWERFNPERFEGFPLTILCLALGYSLVLLGGVVEDLLTADPIVAVDKRLATLLLAFRSPILLWIFLKVTLLGSWQIVLGGVILFSLYLLLDNKKYFLAPFWVTLGGCTFFTTGGKWLFQRQRPFNMTHLMEFSFPSGHTAYSAFFYGFLAYALARGTTDRGKKVDLFFLWVLLVTAVGFSRLYIGVHYLSDVLAGALLGFSWLIIGISLSEWRKSRRIKLEVTMPPPATRKKTYWGPALFTAGVFLYLCIVATFVPHYFKESPHPAALTESMDPLAPFELRGLSRFTETISGSPQEPLSLMIYVQNGNNLITALEKAGWVKAEPVSFRSLVKAFKSALLNNSYPQAPVTPSFWNGVPLDIAFEKETELHSVRQRHHIRLWKTGYRLSDGSLQFVGTASFDKGVNWLHLSHRIDPVIDTERKTFVDNCLEAKIVSNYEEITFVEPSMGSNFSGDAFFSDGKMVILHLFH